MIQFLCLLFTAEDDLFRAFVVEFYPITGKKAKFRKKLLKAMHLSEPPKKPNMPHLPELKHRISPSEFAENMNYMYQVQKFTGVCCWCAIV